MVIPAWLLKSFGLDPLLTFKFLQGLCLILTYRVCTDFISHQGLKIKLWHAILFSGPLFIFLSVLGLRDLQIVLCVSYFSRQDNNYAFFRTLCFCVASPSPNGCTYFWLAYKSVVRSPPHKRMPIAITALTVGGFVAGGYGYAIGGFLKYQIKYDVPFVFTQRAWWRFFANILGLQFLTFGDDVVKMSIGQLLVLRLFFIDTFLIPSLFILTLLNQNLKNSALRTQVYISFVFFLD